MTDNTLIMTVLLFVALSNLYLWVRFTKLEDLVFRIIDILSHAKEHQDD